MALFLAPRRTRYQFEQWRLPLEALATRRPVVVIVDRPDTGRLVLATSALPIALPGPVGSSRRWSTGTGSRRCSTSTRWSRTSGCSLRRTVHIQIGHGGATRAAASPTSTRRTTTPSSVGRLGGSGWLARSSTSTPRQGSARSAGPSSTTSQRAVPIGPMTVGCGCSTPRPGRATGPASAMAPWSVTAPRSSARCAPTLGSASSTDLIPASGGPRPAHGAADARIRAALAADGDRHLVDTGPYGWQWRFADHCITDLSAVAYDWLATGRPLVITEPAAGAYRPPSRLLDALPLLPADAPATSRLCYPRPTPSW